VQNPSASDYLDVLGAELVEHLRRAKAALEPVGSRAVGDLGAAVCAAEVGQALAVLRPLGLELLGMLAEDLARLAASLESQPEARRVELVGLLRHGIDQLRDGIERRALGRPEGAWAVIAVLNELRAALGGALVSQARLFAPDLEAELAGLAAQPGAPHPEFADVARGERIVLHRAMYLWYSNREPERALRKLRRVAQTMRRVAGSALLQRLFLVLEAVAVGASEQVGPPTQALRHLLLQVDALLKLGAEGGEAAVTAAVPPALMRNLLFQVGSCGSVHRIVQSVRRGADLRLLSISGFDGREALAPLLREEIARVQRLLDEHLGGQPGPLGGLAEALQNLSDALGLAQTGELRRQLESPLAALSRAREAGVAPTEALAALQAALVTIDGELRQGVFAPPEDHALPAALPPPVEPFEEVEVVDRRAAHDGADFAMPAELSAAESPTDVAAVTADALPAPVEAFDFPALPDLAATDSAQAAALEALDEDIREVFLEEASERVAALREAYVSWSAQPEDEQELATVLRLLGELKSTGRLVGAHTLSEVCWVLQAALERCRDLALPLGEAVLDALDQGIEAVDSLVAAHVTGAPVADDPRVVEQRLYALLASDPAKLERDAVARPRARRPTPPRGAPDPDAEDLLAAADVSVADILADEADDLVEILAEGLEGLARRPDGVGWLVEMRRALRSLSATARYAQSLQLAALSDALEGVLARAADGAGALGAEARALADETLEVLRAAVDALRGRRTPPVPLDLVDRLRRGDTGQLADAGAVEGGESALPTGQEERGGPSGRALREHVTALRDYVGQLEGIVARLARAPQRSATDVADRARALADLGPCADGIHAVSLAIDALVGGDRLD
jgi:hypothetical protein